MNRGANKIESSDSDRTHSLGGTHNIEGRNSYTPQSGFIEIKSLMT